MLQSRIVVILFSIFTSLFIQSCGPRLSSEALQLLSTNNEVPECLTQQTYTNGLTITGSAQFYKRSLQLVSLNNELKNMILGDPLAEAFPIPFAEVAIYDKNKQLVQCGKTDESGNLVGLDSNFVTNNLTSLVIPKTAQTYTIRVYARTRTVLPSNKFSAIAAVKEDIYSNTVHYVESTFSSNGVNTTPIVLTAYARQTEDLKIRGGAFNIYNNFIQTYLYLDSELTSVSDLSCLSNKFDIYWKAGFNPATYLYPELDPATVPENTSFYIKEKDSLYITGGQVGDISLSNTDHFDDFATVHEMGHFVEDQCGQLTKGGSHALIVRIDPRLSWHEAWANYFATSVIKNRLSKFDSTMSSRLATISENSGWTFLTNTYGFSDSVQNVGNGQGFLVDFKKPGNAPGEWQIGIYFGLPFDQVNASTFPGEGHFREGAISRGLFKVTESCTTGTCATTSIGFDKVWQSMDSITGISSGTNTLISSNLFLETLKTQVASATAWSTLYKPILDSEALHLASENSSGGSFTSVVSGTSYITWVPYGQKTTAVASCAKQTIIQPKADEPFYTGLNSDQRYSNHYYEIDTGGAHFGLDTIYVDFQRLTGTGTDFDVILFKDGYHFNEDYGCSVSTTPCPADKYIPTRNVTTDVVASDRSIVTSNVALNSTFTKSLTNLATLLEPNRKYVLNIRAYTANKSLSTNTNYRYAIRSNISGGSVLCLQ